MKKNECFENALLCIMKTMVRNNSTFWEQLTIDNEYFDYLMCYHPSLANFIMLGIQLVERGVSLNYLAVALEYEGHYFIQASTNKDEIAIAMIYKHLLCDKYFPEPDLFRDFYSQEMNRRSISKETDRKIKKMMDGYFDWEYVFVPACNPPDYHILNHLQRGKEYINTEGNKLIMLQCISDRFEEVEEPLFTSCQGREIEVGDNQICRIYTNNIKTELYWTFHFENHPYAIYICSSNLSSEILIDLIKNMRPFY